MVLTINHSIERDMKKIDTSFTAFKSVRNSTLLLAALLFGIMTTSGFQSASAQVEVRVAPDNFPQSIGSLNLAIEEHGGDVIYILENGASYFLEQHMDYEHPLRIHAEEYPSNNPPIIRSGADFYGSSPDLGRFNGDVEIIGIYMYSLDDLGSTNQSMGFYSESGRVVFRHCYVSAGSNYLFRLEANNITLRIEDCQVRDPGRHTSRANDRFIDTRGHDVDSIIVVNSSLYNLTSNIQRTAGGLINYFEYNHVTITNHMQSAIWPELAREVIIRNSLFQNTETNGVWESRDFVGEAGHYYMGERYFSNAGFVSIRPYEGNIDPQFATDADRNIVIKNNNFGGILDPVFIEVWEEMSVDDPNRELNAGGRPWGTDPQWRWDNPGVDSSDPRWADRDTIPLIRVKIAPMDSLLTAWAAEGVPWVDIRDNIEETIEFTDPPEYWRIADYSYHNWFTGQTPRHYDRWDQIAESPSQRFFHPGPGTPTNPEGPTASWWRDLSYSSETQSYFHGENGYPVGNLNYFPQLRTEWEQGIVQETPTSVDGNLQKPEEFRLLGNYPNPFNPTTRIVYELASPVEVQLEVINILGQTVFSRKMGEQPHGRHEVNFDASQLSSGIYMVRMQMGTTIQTHKMTLVK
jgi:hypothetical protein